MRARRRRPPRRSRPRTGRPRGVPVAVQQRLVVALHGRDQLGEHAGERVDLVAPQRRAGGRVRLGIGEHALEAEHQAVAHLPLRRGARPARLDLRRRVVERAAPRGPGREHDGGIFAVAKERLARPRFRADCCGGQRVRRRENRRLLSRFLHVRSTVGCAARLRKERGRELPLEAIRALRAAYPSLLERQPPE